MLLNNQISLLIKFYFILVTNSNAFNMDEMPFSSIIKILYQMGLETTEHALQNKNVQEFLLNENLTFDLIICEQFYQEAFLLLGYKYKAPIVTIGKCI